MTGIAIVRDADLIAHEIRGVKDQVRRYAAFAAAEIGGKLKEAKALVPHGEWGEWLKTEVDYSQSTANNMMRIHEEFGSNAQALEKLSYTQALALTALPADAREELLSETDVSELSTRELQAAIKEKQELEQQLKETAAREETERAAREEAERIAKELADKQQVYDDTVQALNAELEAAKAAQDDAGTAKVKEQLKKLRDDLKASKERAKELEDQLKAKPIDIPKIEKVEVVPEAVTQELEALRKRESELAEQAKQQTEEANKRIAELEAEAAKRVAAMEEELRKNDNKAAIRFKYSFDSLTAGFKDLLSCLTDVKAANPEAYDKYRKAILTTISKMGESLE